MPYRLKKGDHTVVTSLARERVSLLADGYTEAKPTKKAEPEKKADSKPESK